LTIFEEACLLQLLKTAYTKIIASCISEDQKSCSPSYADFRSRANAAMLLDLGHKLRGEHIPEE
jgi:hypothetical protein